jgi:hypothetical protein
MSVTCDRSAFKFFITEMDIKKFLPGKKLRRSNRLEVKEKMSPDVKKMGPLGYFDLLRQKKLCKTTYQ